MTETVYADILFITNAAITYLLLRLETVIFRIGRGTARLLLASALGGVFSFYILAPEQHFIISSLIKLSFSAAIILTAFRVRSAKRFFTLLLGFYTVSFAFAGIMIALWIVFRPKGMVINNSVVYFNISVPVLLLSCAVCYSAIYLAQRVISKRLPRNTKCAVKISLGDGFAFADGMIDTGNGLRDVFSGLPVIVAEFGLVECLIPDELRDFFRSKGELPANFDLDFKRRLRAVPYESVGGSGVLPAFRPDSVTVFLNDEKIKTEKVIVAVSSKKINADDCRVILNAEMCGNII